MLPALHPAPGTICTCPLCLPQKYAPRGWFGVDLDGTLAHYDQWDGMIGEPIAPMLDRVKQWLADGRDVRIFTARVSGDADAAVEQRERIAAWCIEHIGQELPITCRKDYAMVELWDDRAVQVVTNTGQRADGLE